MPTIHATKFLADRLQKPASAESKKEPAKSVATKYEAGYGPGSQRAYNARYADRPAAYPMDAVKKDSARGGGTSAAPKASAAPTASPPSNKAKANGAPKLSNFGKAFKSARRSGKSEFTFGGKKYNTKLKGE